MPTKPKKTSKPQQPKPEPQPVQRRVPLGPALTHTDEELDALVEMTDEDIAYAAELWRRANAGAPLANLLDAEPEEEQPNE